MNSTIAFQFGTKAETLERLEPLVRLATILPLQYFTSADFRQNSESHIETLIREFSPRMLAVRSSSQAEDGEHSSMAGAFTSCLKVDSSSPDCLRQAIERVLSSFKGNPQDQVLVQPMLADIAVSGVITTHVVDDGAPYYVINYDDESGLTDTVTGGTGVNKTVLINREVEDSMIDSTRVRRWLALAKELESACGGVPLDIEFAQSHPGELFLFQVRRLAPAKRWNRSVESRVAVAQRYIAEFFLERCKARPGLVGCRTILGEMPDWNPAEIIGTNPRPLASSLYQYLITDGVWRRARAEMGYRNPGQEPLMVILGGRPFIDVRNSFNSLIPASLDSRIAGVLVDAWLERLERHPESHDKVEFEIAFTAMDFSFQSAWSERYPGLLSAEDLSEFQSRLSELTQGCILGTSLESSLEAGRRLRAEQFVGVAGSPGELIHRADSLLVACVENGTMPFAIAARHAFIAEAQLRSAVRRGALTVERLAQFKSSLTTVAGRMARDLYRVISGHTTPRDFMLEYGHLRPGTYDILSQRYDRRDDLFKDAQLQSEKPSEREFELTANERRELELLFRESGLERVPVQRWLDYCRKAITGREEVKFQFSRHLSEILELLAEFGQRLELSRDDLSFIEIKSLLNCITNPIVTDPNQHFRSIADSARERMDVTRALRISYLIRDIRDLYVAPMHRSAPTFVTKARIEGRVAHVSSQGESPGELLNAIVCIENADPGFDWVFTRGIAGLVTQFGGSNSHMAVRSAELGLPAAIGCGEQTFQRLVKAKVIELNCADQIIRPLYA